MEGQGFFGCELSYAHLKANDLFVFNPKGAACAEVSLTVDVKLLQLAMYGCKEFFFFEKAFDCDQPGAETDDRTKRADFRYTHTEQVFVYR